MYLRTHNRFKNGKDHIYWTLCETIRTKSGPRQKIICHLGELNGNLEKRWRKTIKVYNSEGKERQLSLFPQDAPIDENDPDVIKINKSKVGWERPREFGKEYIALKLWEELNLDKFYEEKIDKEPGDVAWSKVVAVLAINRISEPCSELCIEERWYKKTALDDIVGIKEEKINTDRLYRCLDLIIKHKEDLEKHLKKRYGELFEIRYDILLYDITSTYFEGECARNEKALRGYSRDHRADCKQICLALVVSEEGFPLAYEIFDGNRVDVTTLEDIIEEIEKKYGKSKRIWIFDRGIVSEENLKILRDRGGQYLVGTRRGKLKTYEKDLLEKGWKKVRDDVEVKLISTNDGEDTYILCKSQGRAKKEKAMRETASKKLEKRLSKLSKQIEKGKIKNGIKIERRIGAILSKYSEISDLYKIEFKDNALYWEESKEKLELRKNREGAYLLRTNINEKDPEKLWEKYMQLTDVEESFKILKSELSIRPIWHQKEKRVSAHILVAFLGYALWVTLKQKLKNAGIDISVRKVLDILSDIKVGDIILETVDGSYKIKLRRISNLNKEQRMLLDMLKITFPMYNDHNTLI